MRFNRLSDIPFHCNLKMSPSCQTLSNTFDMSQNVPQAPYHLPNVTYIPWVIDNSKSLLMQECPDLKFDCFTEIRQFVMKKLKCLSHIFPHIIISAIGWMFARDCLSFVCVCVCLCVCVSEFVYLYVCLCVWGGSFHWENSPF